MRRQAEFRHELGGLLVAGRRHPNPCLAGLLLLLATLLACGGDDPRCATARWQGFVADGEALFAPVELGTGHHDLPAPVLDGFGRAVDTLEARGIRVVLVPVPTRPSVLATFDVSAERAAYGQLVEQLGAHTTVVDVLPIARETEGFFFTRDHHLTSAGARPLAAAIREAAGEMALPPARWEVSVEPEPHNAGSIVRKLNAVCGSALPRPQYHRTRVTRLDPPGLLDPAPPDDVVLVGSSQSGIKGNLGGHLAAELETPVLTVAVEGGGPLEALYRYAQSPEYAAHPPSLLVWELPVQSLAPTDGDRLDVHDPADWQAVVEAL